MNRRRLHILGGLVLGMAVIGAVPGYFTYDYVENDPRFCTTCHLMGDAWGRWETSEHRKITCHACHISDTMGNLKRLYFSVIDPREAVTEHAEVDRSVCLTCHQAGGERWQRVLTTAGHVVHVTKNDMQCMDCHSESVHRFAPPADICAKCHEKLELHERKMDQLECLDCHNYLSDDPSATLKPNQHDCHRCHGEGPREDLADSPFLRDQLAATARPVPTSVVHGDQDCARCHNPHKSELDEMRPGRICGDCHKEQPKELAASRDRRAERVGPERGDAFAKGHECRGCHYPHEVKGAARDACVECHEPFKSELATRHDNKCDTCHKPHLFSPDTAECRLCHEEVGATLATSAPFEHDRCEGCHKPHPAAGMAAGCASCHLDKALASMTARKAEHRECTTCHDPHGERPAPNATCMGCHDKQEAQLALATVKEHAACRSCHRISHGQPEVDGSTCITCHEKEAALTKAKGAPPEHQSCAGCHAPHDPAAKVDMERCQKCHEQETTLASGDKHEGKCASCHAPHGPPKPTVDGCKSCHEEVSLHPNKGGADHQSCLSCHTPHRSVAETVENRCTKCHERQKDSLGVWSSAQEHQRCSSCHIGHEAETPKACASCHEKQGAAVAHTKHQECTTCHRPHETKGIGEVAWWGECARCHQNNAEGVKVRTGPKHKDCESCHPSHEFPKPTCASCHQEILAQLMHQVTEHRDCATCHNSHTKDPPMRGKCVACHEAQQKDHYPESQRCDACHPFAEGAKPPNATRP